jgi:hypothetical protein
MCDMLQVEAIKSRVGALYTFGQPRVGDYEVCGALGVGSTMLTAASWPQQLEHTSSPLQCLPPATCCALLAGC